MYKLLYNPLSRGGKGEKSLQEVIGLIKTDEYEVINVLDYDNYEELLSTFNKEDEIVVIGGDGTLHRYVNEIPVSEYKTFFYAGGTGNDFMRNFENKLIEYSEYIDQPTILTSNEEIMLNGFATGMDCEVLQQYNDQPKHGKSVYFKLAIKNFFSYEPRDVKITVDGEVHNFEKVYIVAVQNGTAFGGGMKVTPHAKNNDGLVDLCVVHNITPWKLLRIFPSVYAGKHLKHTDVVYYKQARHIVIETNDAHYYSSDGELSQKKSKKFEIKI